MRHNQSPVELPCEVCHTWFDPRQLPHDWLNERLVCGDCLSYYTEDELIEMLEGEGN